jgi:hypothetical protein
MSNIRSDSINLLENINFEVVIDMCPNVTFFCNEFNIPSISIGTVFQPTPFSNIKQQGDHPVFAPLSLTFRVDEDLSNYKEILSWINSISFPNKFNEYKSKVHSTKTKDNLVSDITVITKTSKNNANKNFIFKNAWPTDISDISLNIENSTIAYVNCTTTFEYDTFFIE